MDALRGQGILMPDEHWRTIKSIQAQSDMASAPARLPRLKNAKVPKRLINTGGFEKKDRITHRLEITALKDFDDEARPWMKVAYDGDA
jgi:hypothetical protein